jgi:hypothetical protein
LEIQLEVKRRAPFCCPYSIGGLLIATHIAKPEAIGSLQAVLLRFAMFMGCCAFAVSFARAQTPVEPTDIDFSHDIRPLLSDRCFRCHGPDSATREAGLRLDVREVAVGELESGTVAVVPGNLGASELIARIDSQDESMRMPPIDSGKSLSDEERALLRRWVAEGAPYEKHWAFVPPQRPDEPKPQRTDWVRNPIDAFVLAALEAADATPSAEAEPHDLVRRLYLDLTGLPPAPHAVDRFLNDSRPDAYERLVDELMNSPHYGERMAIEWLDGARFADSNGYQNDFRRTMWPWRDWVINAYNANMPYNQFVTEQLAGDLLPNATLSQRVATGFNRNNRTVTEAGSIEEEWRIENVLDRVETSGNVFLGLTIGCARCHDHKFDPISQQEFYEFYAFFNNVNELGVYSETVGNVAPLLQVPDANQQLKLAELRNRVQKAEQVLAKEMDNVHSHRVAWTQQVQQEAPVDEPAADFVASLAGSCDAQLTRSDQLLTPALAHGERMPTQTAEFFGPAIEFTGSERLTYPDSFQFERNSPYSIAVWVKPTAMGAVVSQMSTAEGFRGSDVFILEDFQVAVHLIHEWPANAIKVFTTKPLAAKEWSHIVVSYDGSSKAGGVRIFVNGKEQKLAIDVDNLTDDIRTHQPVRVGSRSADANFAGAVRDVRIFARALEKDELFSVVRGSIARLASSVNLASLPQDQQASFDSWMVRFASAETLSKARASRDEVARLKKELEEFEATVPTSMVMEELKQPRQAYVLERGVYDAPDRNQPVSAGTPDFLPPFPADAPRNRLGLASWLTAANHPLTARVEVNRQWQRFFGSGLVKTSENLGSQAEAPSHPELLDWLATEFVRSGWNVQHIQRLIVCSSTYRQTSRVALQKYEADPENRLLARGPRFRLEAELVRDNALAISGLLNRSVGGRSVMPYQPAGLWDELAGGAFDSYEQEHGPNLYRRGIYTFRKRTVPHPTLATFDAPSFEICQVKRSLTNTPLQSLALLNDVTYVEAARVFAERMLLEGGKDSASRLAYGFRLATGRMPRAEEQAQLAASLERFEQSFSQNPAEAQQLISHGEAPRTTSVDDTSLAAHTAVAAILLNLDETITRN